MTNQVWLMDIHFPMSDIIIFHLGGNDLAKICTVDLLFKVKNNLLKIRQFLNATLIFF